MHIGKIAAASVGILMMIPAVVAAQTNEVQAIQSQIQGLLQQIKTLQEQLRSLMAASTSTYATGTPPWAGWAQGGLPHMGTSTPPMPPPGFCRRFERTLRPGMQGEEVRGMQELLAKLPEAGFTGEPTGFFGPATMRAVEKMQMHFGLGTSTGGTFGPRSREFIERICKERFEGMMMKKEMREEWKDAREEFKDEWKNVRDEMKDAMKDYMKDMPKPPKPVMQGGPGTGQGDPGANRPKPKDDERPWWMPPSMFKPRGPHGGGNVPPPPPPPLVATTTVAQ